MATATPSSRIYDASIAHQIDILRFSTGEVRKLLRLLAEAEADIVAQLQTLAGSESSAEVRLEQVLASTRAINRQAYSELERRLGRTMEELAPVESEFQGDLLANQPTITAAIGYPSTEDLIAAVKARPFDGKYLREWSSQIEAGAFGRLQSAVRTSFFEGESIDQLVRRIRGTKAMRFQDGIMQINRRSAAAVARTAIAHTANVAREETWKANAAIMRGVRWSSVLDGRTTPVCRARDGKIYPLDKGPRPPAHWQCRSTTVPVIKGEPDELQRETYGAWLRRQPPDFVEEIMGVEKASIFLKGGLAIDRFVDASGREYTLVELRNRYPKEWKRARQ